MLTFLYFELDRNVGIITLFTIWIILNKEALWKWQNNKGILLQEVVKKVLSKMIKHFKDSFYMKTLDSATGKRWRKNQKNV